MMMWLQIAVIAAAVIEVLGVPAGSDRQVVVASYNLWNTMWQWPARKVHNRLVAPSYESKIRSLSARGLNVLGFGHLSYPRA